MLQKFFNYLDLKTELENFEQIHTTIEQGVIFKGTNLWILVFAIIVASVGLNTNSTAVIIGAMLISPLMGPINGMGYSIATYDYQLFRKAVKNFSFAVLASLAASTFYFGLSPVSTAHSELLARTSPTIYDVLIALFGGLAGIVAITSKNKGNVIPGVAIATALMPPLCTAGYGLATAKFNFFFGAIYLFTINTVFIAISSILISQVLNFPIRILIDVAKKKKVNRYITAIITITILPSIYFGYMLVQNEKFNENAKLYSNNVTVYEGSYLLKADINAAERKIQLIYGGTSLSNKDKNEIVKKAADFELNSANITVEQGFAFDESARNETEVLKNKVSSLTNVIAEREKKIDSLINKPKLGEQIFAEIKPLFNQIASCAYSETVFYDDSTQTEKTILLLFGTGKKSLTKKEKENILNWSKARLNSENVKVYFE